MAVVLSDWNEDNDNYMGSIFTDANGNIKQGKELEKALEQAKKNGEEFFTDKKNQYLLPQGIAVQDGPKYFAEWQLLTNKYNEKKFKSKQIVIDVYMGKKITEWDKKGFAINTQYSIDVNKLINKYTTRLFGTEKMDQIEYERLKIGRAHV